MKAFLLKIGTRLERLSPLTITVVGLVYVVLLGTADRLAPAAMNFTLFYLVGVLFVAWGSGLRPALALALASAIVLATLDWKTSQPALKPWVLWWNAGTRLVALGATAWLAAELTLLTRRLSRLVDERTEQFKAEADHHKATSQQLAEALERFEQVVNNITEVFWLVEVEQNRVVYVSPGYERAWGRRREDLYREPLSWLSAVHPEDQPTVSRRAQTELVTGEYDVEYRIVRPDGETRWIRARAFPVRNPAGKVYRVAGIAEDITERKRTAEALRVSEQRLAAAMDLAQLTSWEYEVASGLFTFDDRFYRLYGTNAEREGAYQMTPEAYVERFMYPEDLSLVRDGIAGALATTDPNYSVQLEHRMRRRDGATRHLLVRVAITKDGEGRTIRMHGANQDITERKAAEAALAEKEKLYRTLFELCPDGILLEDSQGTILDANQALCRLSGYAHDELMGQNVRSLAPPEGQARVAEHLEKLRRGQTLEHEVWNARKDGRRCLLRLNEKLIALPDGGQGILVVARDITGQKQMEEALRKSEERYRTLAESSPDAIFIIGSDFLVQYVNASAAAAWHCAPERLVGRQQAELFPAELAQRHMEVLRQVLQTGNPFQQDQLVPFPTGESWSEVRLVPLPDERRRITAVMGIVRDIGERKRAESLLRIQRDVGVGLSLTSELKPALTCLLEILMRLEGIDSGGAHLVDLATGDLDMAAHCGRLGAGFLAHVARYAADSPQARAIAEGKPMYGRYEELATWRDAVRDREGLRALAILPLCHEGAVIGSLNLGSHTTELIPEQTRIMMESVAVQAAGAIARIRAETAKRSLEQQLLEVSDREQARFGQDLHDSLCQQLVSLAFDANDLQRQLSAKRRPESATAGRIAEYLDRAITECRQVSRGLFPIRLEDEGLASALQELAKATCERFRVQCMFGGNGEIKVKNRAAATHLFRIAQEAVNNAVKHAQPTRIALCLSAATDAIELKVADDGRGLPDTARKATGMGLHIMDYRARNIGGVLSIEAGRDRGTTVCCRVPLAALSETGS